MENKEDEKVVDLIKRGVNFMKNVRIDELKNDLCIGDYSRQSRCHILQ